MLIGTGDCMETDKQETQPFNDISRRLVLLPPTRFGHWKPARALRDPPGMLAGTADQMQPPPASLQHIQTGGNDEPSHVR